MNIYATKFILYDYVSKNCVRYSLYTLRYSFIHFNNFVKECT